MLSLSGDVIVNRLKTEKELRVIVKKQKEPIVIPLSFNDNGFSYFLTELSNSFKEITFDFSVTKSTRNPGELSKNIFKALQQDGKFYTDLSMRMNRYDKYEDVLEILEEAGFRKIKYINEGRYPEENTWGPHMRQTNWGLEHQKKTFLKNINILSLKK